MMRAFASVPLLAFLLAFGCADGQGNGDNNPPPPWPPLDGGNEDDNADDGTGSGGSGTGSADDGSESGAGTGDETDDGSTGDTADDSGTGDENGETDEGSDSSGDTGDSGDGGDEGGTYAQGISLTTVAFNQGLEAIVGEDGQVVPTGDPRRVTLVKNRPGLLRAFWELPSGWTARDIEARLTLAYEDGSEMMLSDVRTISGPPDENSVDGGFSWQLTAEQVQPGMQFAVGLFEASDTGDPDPSPLPRIPQSGTGEFGIPEDEMVLEITFVPMTVGGTTPDMSAQNVQDLVDGYHNMNPVSEVRMTLHAAVTGNSTDPGSLLSQISQLRSAENAPPQMYYIGLAPVSETGWTGVSNLPGPSMGGDRSSFSPISNTPGNYPSDNSWGFTVHETGHAQGMPHNPGCNAGGPNSDWPWPGTSTIDRVGYDLANDVIRDMSSEDYMNYCFPDWPSSFTWENTVERIRILSSWRVDMSQPKTYLLRGIVSHVGEPPIWWSVPGHPDDAMPNTSPVEVQITLRSGTVVNVQGVSQLLCGEETSRIEVALPAPPPDLSAIALVTEGRTFQIPTEGLTAQYDEYVALYGKKP